MDQKESNHLAAWRKKMGLTQKSLAEYLRISRSYLSMIELGERELSDEALAELEKLISHYQATIPTQLSSERTHKDKQDILAMLQHIVAETPLEIAKLKKRLAHQEKAYQGTLLAIQGFQAAQLGGQVDSEATRQSINRMETEARQKLADNPPVARIRLELQIIALEATLEEAKRRLDILS